MLHKFKRIKINKCPYCKNHNGLVFWKKTSNLFLNILFSVNWYFCPKCSQYFPKNIKKDKYNEPTKLVA